MKKLLVIAAVAMAVVSAKAACVDWKVSGTSATNGYTVYLMTSLADSYASVSELAAAAVDSGTIAKSGKTYGFTSNAVDPTVTSTSMANAYYVIVESGTPTSYTYYAVNMSSMVYDPDKQESSPGTFNSVSAADIISGGTSKAFVAVPEPTSGLLMLLGMCGLALRRRRA